MDSSQEAHQASTKEKVILCDLEDAHLCLFNAFCERRLRRTSLLLYLLFFQLECGKCLVEIPHQAVLFQILVLIYFPPVKDFIFTFQQSTLCTPRKV